MNWQDSIFGKGKQALDTPTLDRKTIVKAYKACIWPVLESHGFDTFKGTAGWRHREKVVDVVDVMFFPRSKTAQWGLDPHCFAISGGVFYRFVPRFGPPISTSESGVPLPPEIACTQRLSPNRRMKQVGNTIPNIWDIAPDGGNLDAVMQEVQALIEEELLPHLDQQGDLRKRLREMLAAQAKQKKIQSGGYYYRGFIALELGEWELARDSLQKALDTGLYSKDGPIPVPDPPEDQIRAAIQQAEAALAASARG